MKSITVLFGSMENEPQTFLATVRASRTITASQILLEVSDQS